jgi:hypothetical protein
MSGGQLLRICSVQSAGLLAVALGNGRGQDGWMFCFGVAGTGIGAGQGAGQGAGHGAGYGAEVWA